MKHNKVMRIWKIICKLCMFARMQCVSQLTFETKHAKLVWNLQRLEPWLCTATSVTPSELMPLRRNAANSLSCFDKGKLSMPSQEQWELWGPLLKLICETMTLMLLTHLLAWHGLVHSRRTTESVVESLFWTKKKRVLHKGPCTDEEWEGDLVPACSLVLLSIVGKRIAQRQGFKSLQQKTSVMPAVSLLSTTSTTTHLPPRHKDWKKNIKRDSWMRSLLHKSGWIVGRECQHGGQWSCF